MLVPPGSRMYAQPVAEAYSRPGWAGGLCHVCSPEKRAEYAVLTVSGPLSPDPHTYGASGSVNTASLLQVVSTVPMAATPRPTSSHGAAKAGHLWMEEGSIAPSFTRREFELDDEKLRFRDMGQQVTRSWLGEFNLTGCKVVQTKNPRKYKFTFRLNLDPTYNPSFRKVRVRHAPCK